MVTTLAEGRFASRGVVLGLAVSLALTAVYFVWVSRAPDEVEGALMVTLWAAAILGAPLSLGVLALVLGLESLLPLPPILGTVLIFSIPVNWGLIGLLFDMWRKPSVHTRR